MEHHANLCNYHISQWIWSRTSLDSVIELLLHTQCWPQKNQRGKRVANPHGGLALKVESSRGIDYPDTAWQEHVRILRTYALQQHQEKQAAQVDIAVSPQFVHVCCLTVMMPLPPQPGRPSSLHRAAKIIVTKCVNKKRQSTRKCWFTAAGFLMSRLCTVNSGLFAASQIPQPIGAKADAEAEGTSTLFCSEALELVLCHVIKESPIELKFNVPIPDTT